ncbi:TerD family protein [Kitasatospora sp. NA04385]|uniref:TerD family protein n=1 Tax=Kitasatospora sp. NA04385 TaxID=2742135 RepID=UPI0015924A41|nr:TerD family protein [Kitasatospora sp. NA04385]QKW19603.1 TerD family protein [Kitasatospora sp. NA04385]
MHQLTKGANAELFAEGDEPGPVTVALSWTDPTGTGDADVSVLLLGADGKVRGDADFLFYNCPSTPDSSVQLLGKVPTGSGTRDRILLDLAALPAEVHQVVLAASRYAGATFGELAELRLAVLDGGGDALVAFDIPEAGEETAFVFGEIYRRGGAWKFRAVGQGYRSGLGGLAGDFGIDVDQDEEAAQAGPATAPAAPSAPGAPGAAGAGAVAGVAGPGPAAAGGAAAAAAAGPKRAVRTAKKRVTLPKAAKADLADHPSWKQARLFSVAGLKNELDRENRATSTLLAVMAEVPEFGRRITAMFNAPAGTVQTFAETSFKHADSTVRPDGTIRVSRAGKIWTALVETKTGGSPLKSEQVQAYLDVAHRHGYETVITLSNDLALDGEPPVTVDRRRARKVALRHLSWAEVAHEAHLLCHHEGVVNPAHAWLLSEFLHYLRHENSGCHGFQNMGPAWVTVRNAISEGTLRAGDRNALRVVENWERLTRQLCLRLGGELGVPVSPVLRGGRRTEPAVRRERAVEELAAGGRMRSELAVPGLPGPIVLEADLRTGRIETTVEVAAAERSRALSRVQWLLRQLTDAPAELRIEALTGEGGPGPCELLRALRVEPGLLVPGDGSEIRAFRLTLPAGMGTRRGAEETGFIRSVDTVVDRFLNEVVRGLKPAE